MLCASTYKGPGNIYWYHGAGAKCHGADTFLFAFKHGADTFFSIAAMGPIVSSEFLNPWVDTFLP